MLMLLSGASGSGKSMCVAALRDRWPAVRVREDDELLATGKRRVEIVEALVAEAAADARAGRSTLLATQAPLGELLAAPSAIEHAAIAACLLDCHDVERLRRVRARQPDDHARFNQHHLNWAAFHRVHAVDSRWQQDVITGQDPSLRCDRWSAWRSGDPRWRVRVIDTTGAGQDEVVAAVAAWVEGLLAAPERAPLRGAWWDES
ncbi:MAG: hypothetical protein KC636_02705 [Myxococcales bacterium]|nr:hypothetical protein [Myxococcales bacterium]